MTFRLCVHLDTTLFLYLITINFCAICGQLIIVINYVISITIYAFLHVIFYLYYRYSNFVGQSAMLRLRKRRIQGKSNGQKHTGKQLART